MNPAQNPESVARRIRGTTWRLIDRSDTGCRLTAPSKEAPARLGELLAIKEGEHVDARRRAAHAAPAGRRGDRRRRDHRAAAGARADAQLDRRRRTPGAPASDRPFFGIYLPAHPENRQSAQRSLIGPDDKFLTGGMVELDTGNARYLIRFTQTLERQAGWSWALFNAVRKLSA